MTRTATVAQRPVVQRPRGACSVGLSSDLTLSGRVLCHSAANGLRTSSAGASVPVFGFGGPFDAALVLLFSPGSCFAGFCLFLVGLSACLSFFAGSLMILRGSGLVFTASLLLSGN